MNRTPIQQIILFFLLLTVLVSIWSLRRKFSSLPEAAVAGRPPLSEAAKVDSSPKIPQALKQTPVEKDLPVSRDFFQPPTLLKEAIDRKEKMKKESGNIKGIRPFGLGGPLKESTPSLPLLELQGIIGGERPQAIINRKILSIGDTIEQAEVISVTPEGVTLSFNGQEVKLLLKDSGKHSSGSRL